MMFFGRRLLGHEDIPRTATPTGDACARCGEPIAPGDAGFIVPEIRVHCDPQRLAFHHACFMRGITGSVAHQERRCSCYVPGSSCGDDPRLTPRQAAEAALALFEKQGS